MENSIQEEKEGEREDGGVTDASLPPAQEDSQDQSRSELGASTAVDEDFAAASNSVQENVSQVPSIPHILALHVSEDMEDQDPLPEEEEVEEGEEEEEEEFFVLGPEHPLVRRQQVALSSQLRKQLERIDLDLREKHPVEKAAENHRGELYVELYKIQAQFSRLRNKLEDRHHTKAQAEAKHRQTQDEVEVTKGQYSGGSRQNSDAKAKVSKLQTGLDNLMLNLIFTKGVSEDLHSQVRAMENARRKVGDEKRQAEEQKLKQDLYVERLTKDMERLTQQIAMYEAQTSAQAEETQAAKDGLSEAEMEMESLAMAHRQLLQQWNSSLNGMRRRDEAFSAMLEAMRAVTHQRILLDREIEGYKRFVSEEQEQNERLTIQLKWSQMDGSTSKKQISQKQTQKEAQHAHYTTCLHTLRETGRTLAALSKESSTYQLEANDQRKQLEKESAVRLELEDMIMTNMQQELTHNKAAKYSQRLTSKMDTRKREMISQLLQLENSRVSVELEGSEVSQHLDGLALIQEALDEEIAKNNKLTTITEAKISSFVQLIGQKEDTVALYHKKIHQIAASTGHEDLSPMQIKIWELMARIEEVEGNINSSEVLRMTRMGILKRLTNERETNRMNMLKIQIEYTGMLQKRVCLEGQEETEHRDETELEKDEKVLRTDLLKLNTLLGKRRQLSVALEQENALVETDFLHRLKEAEQDSIEMQMKQEKILKEKEGLLNTQLEAQRQIFLWEKKILLVKETRSVVDTEVGQGDIQMMKAEIHRMEVRLNQLMKQQEQLLRESEATVERRETIVLRREAMKKTSKQATKGELSRVIQGLQRKIKDTHKHVVECDQARRDFQESQASLGERLSQQRQRLVELCGTSSVLNPDYVHIQDTKDSSVTRLVTLQSRTKKLQKVSEGSYQALSTSESIDPSLQSKMERVHATSAVLHCVCQEFPQHQEALRRVMLALAARTQGPEQGTS
ncbi:coiled-coil domain-containing protein 40 [Halichoeres trimaculatus]|uniref:coiled-coil domain-containing protein 40 n=1 Tax=Halichoeres trimaculatus TaxID=147232 RepID=UPI003D9EE5A7